MSEPMATRQFRLTLQQASGLEKLVKRGIYPSTSEAIRDAVRRLIESKAKR